MKDHEKNKSQLLEELGDLRQRISQLEAMPDQQRLRETVLATDRERLQTLLNATNELELLLDSEGIVLAVNRAAADKFDTTIDRIVGRSVLDFMPPDVAAARMAQCRDVAQTGKPVRFPDEQHGRMIDNTLVPVLAPDGSIVGIAWFASEVKAPRKAAENLQRQREILEKRVRERATELTTEIAEHKRTSEELAKSRERWAQLFRVCPAWIVLSSPKDGRILDVNQAFVDFLGYSREEMIGRTSVELGMWGAGQRAEAIQELEREGIVYRREIALRTKSGELRHAFFGVAPVDLQGAHYLVAAGLDITERRQAEEELRVAKETIEAMLNAAGDSMILLERDNTISRANYAAADMFSKSIDEIVGKPVFDLFPPEFAPIREATIDQLVQTGKDLRCEDAQSGKVLHHHVCPVLGSGGSVERIVISTRDITEIRQSEHALRQSEETLRRILDACPIGIGRIEGRKFDWANEAMLKMFGFTDERDFLGTSARSIYPSDEEYERTGNCLYEAYSSGRTAETEAAFRRKDGSTFHGHIRASALYPLDPMQTAIVSISDISEKKRQEQLLLQTERFRAVADLARGIAHNFNNLLQIVIGNVELALVDLQQGNYSEIEPMLEKVLKSSRFAAETVRRLDTLVETGEQGMSDERETFDLSEMARFAIETSRSWWKTVAEKRGKKVSLHESLEEGCSINAEKTGICQLIVDLIRNAVEAVHQEGDIDIKTFIEGDQVFLKVRDSGIGINEENLGRVFNPFFTTKAEPGSGLGLASGRKLVEELGGHMLVESAPGEGTTFTVVLPLAKGPQESTDAEIEGSTRAHLTILVIDDMEEIVNMLKSLLNRQGHTVLTALSGEEGFGIFQDNQVDLVICDLIMPEMSGWEVGKRIRATCEERGVPKVPFVLLTGWAGALRQENTAQSAVDWIIEKPVKLRELLAIVRQVMDPRQTGVV